MSKVKSFLKKFGGKKDQKSHVGQKNSPVPTITTVRPSGAIEAYTKAKLLEPIKTFSETSDVVALFLHKLRLCSIIFDWHGVDSQDDVKAKDVKRQQLLELVEYIGKNKEVWVPEVLEATVEMVGINLFRSLPPKQHENSVTTPAEPKSENEEEEPIFEPAWPHLQIVYEFFSSIHRLG